LGQGWLGFNCVFFFPVFAYDQEGIKKKTKRPKVSNDEERSKNVTYTVQPSDYFHKVREESVPIHIPLVRGFDSYSSTSLNYEQKEYDPFLAFFF
jgi:hypothetical protein